MKFATNWTGNVLLVIAACLMLTACNERPKSPAFEFEFEPDNSPVEGGLRISTLRAAAIQRGLTRPEELWFDRRPKLEAVGSLIFDSPLMSLNSSISCRDCHLDEFSSTDGLPNAVGAGASGIGAARMHTGGDILPRNVLPLWGRGNKGFETFFWDGKVELDHGKVVSQFGSLANSSDPMLIAVQLPSVEIREMLADSGEVRRKLAQEDVTTAEGVQDQLTRRFKSDQIIGSKLAQAVKKDPEHIRFIDVAQALAAFIRHEFRVRSTRFHRFVFDDGPISQSELNGGILFYGRGRCAACHGGPYFSDLQFHAVAFPQAGFGKNGFG
ncbi:MAG: hypothetical protein KDE63_12925, partial [Novosphingobium sp.]|nr:hypothetical protein [Novosphingobium sp.]